MKKKSKKLEAPVISDQYQAEDDMRTLMRAEEIKSDPERLSRLHKHGKKHMGVIKSIKQLKEVAKHKMENPSMSDDDGDE